MSGLRLSDLLLILKYFLGPKLPALRRSRGGQLYEPYLRARLAELEALPAALLGAPLAEILSELDDLHDLLGMVAWLLSGAYAQLPLLTPEQRDLARTVRARFISGPAELQKSYADEGAAAHLHQQALTELAEALRAFPIAPNLTWYDLLRAFVEAGLNIDATLAQRADLNRTSRARATHLRTEIIGLLNRLRGVLTDEVAITPELPRDLVEELFAYTDQLAASRQRPGHSRGSAPPATDEG